MEENMQTEDGISLLDIFRLLLSKIKILLLVVLLGAILGAALGVWKTHNVDYYGTSVEFYVNPEKKSVSSDNTQQGGSQYGVYGAYGRHVMDNMVRLLGSEIFAEQLMLGGNVLPAKQEGNTSLNAKIDVAEPLLEIVEQKQAKAKEYSASYEEKLSTYNSADNRLNDVWKTLYLAEKVKQPSFSEAEYMTYVGKAGYTNLETAYSDKQTAQKKLESAWENFAVAQAAANEAQENASTAVEEALTEWRNMDSYKGLLNRIVGSTKYAYVQGNTDAEDANNLARSFIYVKISVLNDKEFSEDLLERIKKIVPIYIEANMAVPDGYQGTNCQPTTTINQIVLTNPGYTRSQTIKYALLLAAVTGVVACVVVILLDRSDKRLRDYDVITKKFNIPVLGVVPAIDDLVPETPKKKTEKDTEVKV